MEHLMNKSKLAVLIILHNVINKKYILESVDLFIK